MARFAFLALCAAASIWVSMASPCITFDADFNLLAFGVNGKDYHAGKKDSWGNGNSIRDITKAPGRPPFNAKNTQCYLAQYFNSIYFTNADTAHPSDIHIYDASKHSWSTQHSTPASGMDFSNFVSILDHDTNVIYALSKGQLFFADMGERTAASSKAVKWDYMPAPDFDVTQYKPVMALAQNHVHFMNIGGNDGRAHIFVIHYAYWQPMVQSYKPKNEKGTFPETYGTAVSLFQSDNVDQKEFAFFPQDGRGTYVINTLSNSTLVLPAPPSKDVKALYAGCSTSLVQLDGNNTLSYLPYVQGSSQYPTEWRNIGHI
ncbi:hypothetical protein PWT90_09466 [Aphanocladium album]|nr:hypothetical protein PWT90_09466 [Aphanocladium album]